MTTDSTTQRVPAGLGVGRSRLWRDVVGGHELDVAERVVLLEACRAKDRLDRLAELVGGETDVWARGEGFVLVVANAPDQANATAKVLQQLLAALRLPDEWTGKRPQYRGPRGVQRPSVRGGAPGDRRR